ncbi:hypothetical protein Hanom_Chr16g01417341 [Helianthus anomalus]
MKIYSKNNNKLKKKNSPGHIGLISENQPGITEDMFPPPLTAAAAALSSPSLSFFMGEPVTAAVTLCSAICVCVCVCAYKP